MTGRGNFSQLPHRRLRLMVGVHLLWLGISCVLGAWWGYFLLRQAEHIAGLEKKLGIGESGETWEKIQRMLFWESIVFFGLLLAATVLVLWIYWLDAKRSRALQTFFASVTHELRTPLTSIRLQAETIAENARGDSSQASLVERLLEDTSRLESQVERTLELARVEGGGPVYLQSLRLRPWIDRTLQHWQESYAKRLNIKNETNDVSIQADPSALQVILKNLLENSLKHSRKDPVTVILKSEHFRGRTTLVYSDNGKGFEGDSKSLGRLFHKGPSSQGAGVGLYLVQMLMMRMGGKAEFSGRDGFIARMQFQEATSNG